MQVQYIGVGHTVVQTDKKVNVKTKVVNGEIIDVTPDVAKSLKYRGFQIITEEALVEDTEEAPKPKKKK